MRYLLLICFLAGCTPKRITGPDGRSYYEIRCRDTMSACYKKATKVCDGNYTVLSTTDRSFQDTREERFRRAGEALSNSNQRNVVNVNVNSNNNYVPPPERTEFLMQYDCR